MGQFNGKVVVVTGGTSGIGRATALAFARAGATVVIAARRRDKGQEVLQEITRLGGEVAFLQTDVSRAEDVESLVQTSVERFGRVDYAFNNAATLEVGSFRRLAEFSEEEFDQHLAFNLKSVWLCMKYQIQQMLQQGRGGVIANTSSVNGLGGVAHGALYAAAKAGVLGLTKSAALEYASKGIRVNALVAGDFRTPMLEGVFAQMGGGDPGAADAVAAQLEQMVPLGRIGRPEEAAETVLWLCSDSSSYVTGHSMIVDGCVTATYRRSPCIRSTTSIVAANEATSWFLISHRSAVPGSFTQTHPSKSTAPIVGTTDS